MFRMDAELWFRDWAIQYEGFPDDYLVIDTETSGSDRQKDVIIQIGWCKVVDRKVVDNNGVILNWIRSPLIDPNWVRKRMASTRDYMISNGKSYPWEYCDLLQGIDPVFALSDFLNMLSEVRASGNVLVAHNGAGFDLPLIVNHFKRFLNIHYNFNLDELWDTGALEKASQLDELLCEYETAGNFSYRVTERCNDHVRWSLYEHVVPKYDFVHRYNLDLTKAHTAPFDTYVTHLLFEEFRELAERGLERQPL